MGSNKRWTYHTTEQAYQDEIIKYTSSNIYIFYNIYHSIFFQIMSLCLDYHKYRGNYKTNGSKVMVLTLQYARLAHCSIFINVTGVRSSMPGLPCIVLYLYLSLQGKGGTL